MHDVSYNSQPDQPAPLQVTNVRIIRDSQTRSSKMTCHAGQKACFFAATHHRTLQGICHSISCLFGDSYYFDFQFPPADCNHECVKFKFCNPSEYNNGLCKISFNPCNFAAALFAAVLRLVLLFLLWNDQLYPQHMRTISPAHANE